MTRQTTYMTGAHGKGVFGSATLDLVNWSLECSGDDADLTHGNSNGLKIDMAINDEYRVTFGLNWKASAMPTQRPPALYRGETGTLKLYVSKEAYISVPVEIKTHNIRSVVNDVVKSEVTAKATSAPTWPSTTHLSSSSSSQSASSSSSSTSSST